MVCLVLEVTFRIREVTDDFSIKERDRCDCGDPDFNRFFVLRLAYELFVKISQNTFCLPFA